MAPAVPPEFLPTLFSGAAPPSGGVVIFRAIHASCRCAPAMTRASSRPRPSASRPRLAPPLSRSVGFGPIFSPVHRGLGHRPIGHQPAPVDLLERFARQQALVPEALKHACIGPLAKPSMGRRVRTQARSIERSPWHAGTQQQQDGVHRDPVGDARAVAAQWMRFRRWNQWCHPCPHRIAQAPAIIMLRTHRLVLRTENPERWTSKQRLVSTCRERLL